MITLKSLDAMRGKQYRHLDDIYRIKSYKIKQNTVFISTDKKKLIFGLQQINQILTTEFELIEDLENVLNNKNEQKNTEGAAMLSVNEKLTSDDYLDEGEEDNDEEEDEDILEDEEDDDDDEDDEDDDKDILEDEDEDENEEDVFNEEGEDIIAEDNANCDNNIKQQLQIKENKQINNTQSIIKNKEQLVVDSFLIEGSNIKLSNIATIIMDNINNIKQDQKYIHQGKAINESVSVLIDLTKLGIVLKMHNK